MDRFPAASQEFQRRARYYRHLDAHLAARTRFFAAAALTNTVLAELCVHRGRWFWISRPTIGALLSLGGMLENVNSRRVACLASEGGSGDSLDASFVEMEQAFVESVLQTWARDRALQYRQLVAELDRLLRAAVRDLLPVQCSADVRRYMQVLRSVSMRSGRSPSFADRADRILIGNALVEEARRSSASAFAHRTHTHSVSRAPDRDYSELSISAVLPDRRVGYVWNAE